MMRELTAELLEDEPDFEVCGSAESAEKALQFFDTRNGCPAELVLIDVSLPTMSGIDLVAALATRRPGLPCLLLSAHQERTYVSRGLAAGARGYILKGNPDELPEAVRHVIGGEIYLSEPLRDGD